MAKEKAKLSKRTIYTIFLAKFVFSLALIFWTVKMTLGAGVGLDDDNTFFSTYHHVDDNYNKIIQQNTDFANKYDIEISINNDIINSLTYNDIYLSQRAIKDRKDRKNMLNVGKNSIFISVMDKETKHIIKDINSTVIVTIPSTHKLDQTIHLDSEKPTLFDIPKKSFWNIMGSIEIGQDKGYFYIKTNAK